MKKILFLLLSWLPLLLWADNVTPEQARETATNFFFKNRQYASGLRLVSDGRSTQTRAAGEAPAYYIFNNDGGQGFVIVSGEDLTRPILGYSFDGSLESNALSFTNDHTAIESERQLNPNFRYWLSEMKRQIEWIRRSPGVKKALKQANAQTRAQGGGEDETQVGNILKSYETAQWNQDAPYWNFLTYANPEYLGPYTQEYTSLVVTGCTCTATCIAMRYHEWPVRGQGTLKGYTCHETYNNQEITFTVPEIVLGDTYEWNKMMMTYNNNTSTEEEKNAVALLMQHVGSAIDSQYGIQYGTASDFPQVVEALTTYFDYNPNMRYVLKDSYTEEDWRELIIKELDNGPMIYGGTGEGGGHAFILDAYTDKNYFHFNWGWGGYCNGFYALDALKPGIGGIGAGDNGDYSSTQDAIIGMCKNEGQKYLHEIRFLPYTDEESGYTYKGITTDAGQIKQNEPFHVYLGAFCATGSRPYSSKIEMAHCRKDGTIKDICYSMSLKDSPIEPLYLYWNDFTCKIKQPIEPGDYLCALYYPDPDTEVPAQIKGNDECISALALTANLADNTSMEYVRSTKMLTLTTLDGVQVTITGTDGADLSAAIKSGVNGVYEIDTAKLPAGTSTIKLESGTQVKEVKFTK